jgi:hypothetical protein
VKVRAKEKVKVKVRAKEKAIAEWLPATMIDSCCLQLRRPSSKQNKLVNVQDSTWRSSKDADEDASKRGACFANPAPAPTTLSHNGTMRPVPTHVLSSASTTYSDTTTTLLLAIGQAMPPSCTARFAANAT